MGRRQWHIIGRLLLHKEEGSIEDTWRLDEQLGWAASETTLLLYIRTTKRKFDISGNIQFEKEV